MPKDGVCGAGWGAGTLQGLTMLKPRFVAILAGVHLALVGGASAQVASDAALAAKVDAIAERALAQPKAVGLSIAVGRGDQVVLSKGYGKADLEFDVPMNAQTMLRIGSVTKQFSAAAVMKLVEQGKLSLDDTLDKLLPAEYPDTGKLITLRQILNHTSGIWSYTNDDKFMGRDASLELTPAELIATFKDRPLEFAPGSQWQYSNSAYYLVGEIIARASGKAYAQFLQDEFFTPLGLTRTRYDSNSEVVLNRAQGYGFENRKLRNDRAIGADVPGAAGSLISSAEGLVRWNIALVNGKVVSKESYTLMTTPGVLSDGSPTRYGLGLEIGSFAGHPRIGHGGGIFGFTSMLAYLPEEKITVAVISNCDSLSPGTVADAIMRAALGMDEVPTKDLPVSAAEHARFAGEFAFEDIPMTIKIFEQDGKVMAQGSGQGATRLLYQGNGEFRAEFGPGVKIVFPAGEGPAATLVLHQNGEHTAKRKP